MCEYCGCQSVPAISELTAEHDQIREIAHELEVAARRADLPVARVVAQRLLDLLLAHTAVEERGLFPELAAEFGGHVDALTADHRRLEATLRELASTGPAPEGWPMRLRAATGELFDHILREQDGLFPAALSVLTPRQWDRVDAVRRDALPGLLTTHYT